MGLTDEADAAEGRGSQERGRRPRVTDELRLVVLDDGRRDLVGTVTRNESGKRKKISVRTHPGGK